MRVDALRRRKRREFEFDLTHQFIDTEAREFRPQCAGVEPGHVEQCAQYFLDRLERGVDVVDQAAVVLPPAFGQAGDVEPRRVERLQDVVAGRCKKLCLGNIGGLGFAFGMRERSVEASQFLGSFPHAPFQCFIRPLEGLGRLNAGGNVGERGDDAAVRHSVCADFDHHALRGSRQERLAAGNVALKLRLDEFLGPVDGAFAAPAVEAHDVRQVQHRPGSSLAAGRGSHRIAGSSRSAEVPCRRPRCPGARDRARSAGSRGCTELPRWHRRAISTPPWSTPCACAAGARAPIATTRRQLRTRECARHAAPVENLLRPSVRG